MDKYLKHFIIWYEENTGVRIKSRKRHADMERLVNSIIKEPTYIPESLRVIVGTEQLQPDRGKELI